MSASVVSLTPEEIRLLGTAALTFFAQCFTVRIVAKFMLSWAGIS